MTIDDEEGSGYMNGTRINFNTIATFVVTEIAANENTKNQMRAGFESYVNAIKFAKQPYTVDEDGNYMMQPAAVLYILDHVTPSLKLAELKRLIMMNEINYDEIAYEKDDVASYVITGIQDDMNMDSNYASMKNIIDMMNILTDFTNRIRKAMNI